MLQINIENNHSQPKYQQLMNGIINLIETDALIKGDRLPSCNDLCKTYNFSQDTVYKAYNELKKRGVITAKAGLGYFVNTTNLNSTHKVFVLFDHLTAYKEELYNAFKQAIKGKCSEQIFFHNNNPKVFQALVESSVGEFTDFVIMPINDKQAMESIELLPAKSVIILDRTTPDLKRKYAYVTQEFERDIYQILSKNSICFERYTHLILSVRHAKSHFRQIISGFRSFCKKIGIPYNVLFDLSDYDPKKGDVFIVVDDKDLVEIVKKTQTAELEVGKEVGIISYNETPLKQIITGGITTISTDFRKMGQTVAEMIESNKKTKTHNPFIINRRNSF